MTVLLSNVRNNTFQNFAHVPLQELIFMTPTLSSTYVIEKGAFAHLSTVLQIMISNEALPALVSLRSPLQKLIIQPNVAGFQTTNKTTLQLLEKFN